MESGPSNKQRSQRRFHRKNYARSSNSNTKLGHSHYQKDRLKYSEAVPSVSCELEGVNTTSTMNNILHTNKRHSDSLKKYGRNCNKTHKNDNVDSATGVSWQKELWSYTRLKKLVESTSDNIIDILANQENRFADMLKSKPRTDLLFLILKLLNKVCSSEFVHNQTAILTGVCSQEFIDHLKGQITDTLTEENNSRVTQTSEFFNYLLNFFEKVIELLPSVAFERLNNIIVVTEVTIQGIGPIQGIEIDKSLFEKLDHLKKQFNVTKQNMERAAAFEKKQKYADPPDDFRDLSLYPTPEDMVKRNFLRPNIVKGSFLDTYQYLDIQFRLLREDFIEPLRDGIKLHKKSLEEKGKRPRNPNLRIYNNVTFAPSAVSQYKRADKILFTVQLEMSNYIKRINWEYSKRFMYGSLLLYSADNFNTFFLCIVQDNDKKVLSEKGTIKVTMIGDQPTNLINSNFIMAESTVFFEPYFQILRAMKNMSIDSLPMEDYILSKDAHKNVPPAYLLGKDSAYSVNGATNFRILDPTSWPTKTELGLDDSQYSAFMAALGREFVVIQGPPGTGKTYLGLLIAKFLLNNINNWHNGSSLPMAVICYTNHALDQFLEGLLSATNKLVRIGGMSKNENLINYNIRQLKIKSGFNRSNLMKNIQNTVAGLRNKMHYVQSVINGILLKKGVLKLQVLKEVMSEIQYRELNGFKTFQLWLINDYIGTLNEDCRSCETTDSELNRSADVDEFDLHRRTVFDEQLEEIDVLYDSVRKSVFDITLRAILLKVNEMEIRMRQINIQDLSAKQIYSFMSEKDTLQKLQSIHDFIQKMLSVSVQSTVTSNNLDKSVWDLSSEDRWKLYNWWSAKLLANFKQKVTNLQIDHDKLIEQLHEINEMEDMRAIRDHNIDVLGLTTTGAAKHRPLLKALKPQIVIVEEAAEVLEAHIVVSLTQNCEHVILIGDHKQLRPNPATFKLAKEYHLDISLFERMIENGMNAFSLEVQHRMKPEIASLVTPAIYPHLINHETVLNYPHIKGIESSLFFIDHEISENEADDIESHLNKHEADFLVALCRHLILQNYKTDDITVLTTYSAQFYYLKKEIRKHDILNGVRVTVVDNFQGEENNIILLSLVRSNPEAKIGFLNIENRVCVALSRAKHGFYIVGNMSNLKQKSELWKKINDTLKSQNAIGPDLTLICQIHNKKTFVHSSKDFDKVIEGGCDEKCNKLLQCGHYCKRLCHIMDIEHQKYKCFEKCNREICQEFNHPCPHLCYEACKKCIVLVRRTLKCKHEMDLPCQANIEEVRCLEPLEVTLPHCGHKVIKPCHWDIEKFPCPEKCDIRLFCGHSCEKKCHVLNDPDHLEYKCYKDCPKINKACSSNHPCSKRCFEECGECTVLVKKTLLCGHMQRMRCSISINDIKCEKPCKKNLNCGHLCKNKCWEPCGNCQEKVEKCIPDCGHKIKIACCTEPSRTMCRQKCERTLPCSHKCVQKCKDNCSSFKCKEVVPCPVKPVCGHNGLILCYKKNEEITPYCDTLLRYCKEPCTAMLPCGDKCTGTCGECMQGRIHKVCTSKCGNILICGHTCSDPCRFECPPCKAKCTYKCKHSRCNRRCGEPCRPCMERCDWKCPHYKCNQKCGALCDRPPCYNPCKKILKCGHECVGFCGDVCPQLCRICDEEELCEIFFGTEDEEDARFILLEDCQHILESSGLENWINGSETSGHKEIGIISCPKCKTPIQNTMRFMNFVKKNCLDVQAVKKKIFGQERTLIQQQKSLLMELEEVQSRLSLYFSKNVTVLSWIDELNRRLSSVWSGRRNFVLGLSEIRALSFIVKFLTEMDIQIKSIVTNLSERSESRKILNDRINLLFYHLQSRNSKISPAEMKQFERELSRFCSMVYLYTVTNKTDIKNRLKDNEYYIKAKGIAHSVSEFTEKTEKEINDAMAQIKKLLAAYQYKNLAEERRMIRNAMAKNFGYGSQQGHWFKCSKGHIYCITECGGAVQMSKCPECGEAIGGTSYNRVRSNRPATEMDMNIN